MYNYIYIHSWDMFEVLIFAHHLVRSVFSHCLPLRPPGNQLNPTF